MKRLWLGAGPRAAAATAGARPISVTLKRTLAVVAVATLTAAANAATAYAGGQSSSPDYQVNEVQIGSGGLLNATSPNYQAQQSLGATTGGRFSSPSYSADAGFLTPNAPFLEMVVNPATINFGTLSPTSPATGTATFHVRAYVDSGYTVVSMNNPPTNEEGAALSALSSPTASSPGTEQYGINLVQNQTTCTNPAPANFGANPVAVPDSSFASGIAAPGYNTCGLFAYVKGQPIAESSGNGWGETDYTISYLVNIDGASKAGTYNMTQDLVAIATY